MTDRQRRSFFRSLGTTARDLGADREAYRRQILLEELGIGSLTEVSTASEYDRLMTRMAVDRGDYEEASRYGNGTMKRMHYLIVLAATRIVRERHEGGTALDYVLGVLRQAKLAKPGMVGRAWAERLSTASGWLDFTEQEMRKVLQILQCEVRRLGA